MAAEEPCRIEKLLRMRRSNSRLESMTAVSSFRRAATVYQRVKRPQKFNIKANGTCVTNNIPNIVHFSAGVIMVAAATFYSVSAAPVLPYDNSTSGGGLSISAVVNHLDSKGQIDWVMTSNGGRIATIPAQYVDAANQALNCRSLDLQTRGPKADVGGWTNAGQIAQQAASYACEKSGEWGVSSTIEAGATDACSNLLKAAPGAVQAEAAWNVYQAVSQPDDAGGSFTTIYRWFYNTVKAPSLTEQICTSVYQKLRSDFCQGKGNNGTNTRGGEMEIGSGDDYLMVGVDPNKAYCLVR
ncbi:MAG: hypothetical protein Q9200_002756 [Gallowayella weberi]